MLRRSAMNFLIGRTLGLLYLFLFVVVSGLWIIHAQQKQESNFTGTIQRIQENSQAGIAHIHFDPGARTKWHSHERGQVILVEDGVTRTQLKGKPVMELHAGDTTYAPPGVPHWHGAAPDQGTTQFNVQRGKTNWFDAVTDKEYNARTKR